MGHVHATHGATYAPRMCQAYEDFEAVAKDLVARGITSHSKLGCQGGSNGGLLTGNMLARSPELFGAIVCQVPLLDMRRFHKLLAGASWVGEYGDPDTDDWEFLQKYSPYHNVRPDVEYPPILLTTSTRDDRVHPGHARKLVSKLVEMGKTGTYYYENVEGGHGGAADNKQRAFMNVLAYDFLEQALTGSLKGEAAAPKQGSGGVTVVQAMQFMQDPSVSGMTVSWEALLVGRPDRQDRRTERRAELDTSAERKRHVCHTAGTP